MDTTAGGCNLYRLAITCMFVYGNCIAVSMITAGDRDPTTGGRGPTAAPDRGPTAGDRGTIATSTG